MAIGTNPDEQRFLGLKLCMKPTQAHLSRLSAIGD